MLTRAPGGSPRSQDHEPPQLRLHPCQRTLRHAVHRLHHGIVKRTWQHKGEVFPGFTKQYGVHILVWYEIHEELMAAATREKQIKHWKRAWKVRLVSESNPHWRDLYDDFTA